MCTLILGRDILGPDTTILAANRDEDPGRPSDPPTVFHDAPRVAGGRDRVALGTWLAVREDAAFAMLNRRPGVTSLAATRSRGLLALDVASRAITTNALDDARATAISAITTATYAPFSLVAATCTGAWVLSWDGVQRTQPIAAGWHVLTHADLDDTEEARTRRLLRDLDGLRPGSAADAEHRLRELLAAHDEPRVCLHEGRMSTVSYVIVTLTLGGMRYLHGEGRPCERAWTDYSELVMAGRKRHA